MIGAVGVTVRRGGRALLEDVPLAVAPGEVVALVGPNGAGKSTLLNVLSGALRPDAGSALFAGRPLRDWRPLDLARRRAVVGQQARLAFAMTAAEVVALGRLPWHGTPHGVPACDAAAVASALRQVGLPAALAGRVYATLSGGEQRRVQLARALAQLDGAAQPSALLLDEPTASLDPGHAAALLRTLRGRAGTASTAVLAVLHDLNQAAFVADRVAVLSGGRLVAAGPPAEALRPEALAAVYGVSFRAITGGGLLPDFGAPSPRPAPEPAFLGGQT